MSKFCSCDSCLWAYETDKYHNEYIFTVNQFDTETGYLAVLPVVFVPKRLVGKVVKVVITEQ